MKTKLLSWMTIAMMAFVSVGFASCGGDDDDKNGGGSGGGTSSNVLVGTWSRDYYTGDGTKAKEVFTFSASSGTYRNAYQTATFTYAAANGYIAIKIRYSDSSEVIDDVWPYSVNGKTLLLNGISFTKQ